MHIDFARKHGIETIELAAAHSPRTANVSPEKLADPVAHHVNMETNRDGTGRDLSDASIETLVMACDGKVSIGTLGAFENLLNANLDDRKQNLEHIRRAIRAAEAMKIAGLGTEGVTIFVGRDISKTVKENMRLFAKVIIPIVRYAKEHDVIIYIENCPMCGWSETHEVFTQNVANVPLHWILMARMIEAAELRGWCCINYDPSHDILQGMRPSWSFKIMREAGYQWFIGRFHGKDLSRQNGRVAMAGFLGQRVAGGPWDKMNGDQPLPGGTKHDALAIALGHQVDWFGMLVSAREDLGLDMSRVTFTTEHEHSEFRNPAKFRSIEEHWEIVGGFLDLSINYIQGIDAAAAAHVEMHQVIESHSKTWSWQNESPAGFETMQPGAQSMLQAALKWQLPNLPKTSDLVIGD